MLILNKHHKRLNFLLGDKTFNIEPREIKEVPDDIVDKILTNKHIYKVQAKPIKITKK